MNVARHTRSNITGREAADAASYVGALREQEPMARHSTWRAGGPARRYFEPASIADLQAFMREGLGDDTYYGYQENLYDVVAGNFERFGINREKHSVSLVKGLVQDTLHPEGPIALAHIDVDWYEPVMVCLQRIFPRLVPGGSIVIDDYHDWGGCRKATDEYLRDVVGQFRLDDSAGSLKLSRVPN